MKMIFDVAPRSADCAHIGPGAAEFFCLCIGHEALEDLFVEEMVRDLVEKLDVEPGGDATNLDPCGGAFRQQAMLAEHHATRLVEIFADDSRARHGKMIFLNEHRCRAGGIERKECRAVLPLLLLDEVSLHAKLAHDEANIAGVRTKRVVIEGGHE